MSATLDACLSSRLSKFSLLFGALALTRSCYSIRSFVEKPQEFVSNKINAGMYIFNQSVLNRMEVSGLLLTCEALVRG